MTIAVLALMVTSATAMLALLATPDGDSENDNDQLESLEEV